MHLGSAFQIMDDVLDYSGDAAHIGKNLGDDLAEGKMTLPLIRAIAVGSPEEASVIRHAVSGGGLTDFAPVMATLQRTGALDYARERAQAEAAAAASCVRALPHSPAADGLLQLSTFAAQRSY
jgi:octaprenyl-diphosphate synthase